MQSDGEQQSDGDGEQPQCEICEEYGHERCCSNCHGFQEDEECHYADEGFQRSGSSNLCLHCETPLTRHGITRGHPNLPRLCPLPEYQSVQERKWEVTEQANEQARENPIVLD